MTHKTVLLPCPFCGKPATWATTHHVACGNESCALGLSEFLCWDHQWNTRAPALSPPKLTPREPADVLSELIEVCCKTPNHVSRIGDLRNEFLESLTAPALSPPGMGEIEKWLAAYEAGTFGSEFRKRGVKLIRNALAAPRVPEGWALVPKEPTYEMFDVFDENGLVSGLVARRERFAHLWTKALAAAPQPPASEGEGT